MMIKYRYIQAGKSCQGQLECIEGIDGHHEVVLAVVQKIANDAGETVAFGMLDKSGLTVVGTNHVSPEGVDDTGLRTINSVEISEDDGVTWQNIYLV